MRNVKLDIGAGRDNQKLPAEDWLHQDIQPHPGIEIVSDFGAIPLPDGACAEIFLGDVIEHVPQWRLDEVFAEWNRICAIGAIVTGRTPNPDRCLRDLAAGKLTMRDFLGAIYGAAAWGEGEHEVHYMAYDRPGLTALFARYGFEVTDFTTSPGPAAQPWWFVFAGRKVRDL